MRTEPLMEPLESRILLDGGPLVEGLDEVRVLDFGGLRWFVRTDDSPASPGDNWYSDSTESVWLDADGLHLKIRYQDGTWYGAEVFTTQPTSTGAHRFYVDGRVDLLDPNITLALTLSDGVEVMGIDFDTDPAGGANARYSVGPVESPTNVEAWTLGLNGALSTHIIEWQPNAGAFSSHHWHTPEPTTPAHLLGEWQYAGPEAPGAGAPVIVSIGLWLENALPPTDAGEFEIVIAAMDAPNQAPTVESLSPVAHWRLAGETVTVIAKGVDDTDSDVEQVQFFRDANGDGIGQAGEMLGVDSNAADGWTWSEVATWPAGRHTLLARAMDDRGAFSRWVDTEVTIESAPAFTAVIGSGPNAQGRKLRFTDPEGAVVTVKMIAGEATLSFVQEPIKITTDSVGLLVGGGIRLVDVTLRETSFRSVLSFSVVGGDRRVEIGRIRGTEPIKKIVGSRTDLVGSGLELTGDGFVKVLRLGNLLNGADIRIAGDGGRRSLTLTAGAVGIGSVIDVMQGPIKGMTFTGEFAGVVAAGISAGDDGLWFTDDDFMLGRVRTGKIKIKRPAAATDGVAWGVLTGPRAGRVVLPKSRMPAAGEAGFLHRSFAGPDLEFTIDKVRGKPASRTLIGTAADVARNQYRVAIYVTDDAGLLRLQRRVAIDSRGRWRAGRLPEGRLYAWLVHIDRPLVDAMVGPFAIDGRGVIAQVTLD